MGGDYEEKIETPKVTTVETGGPDEIVMQGVRFHKNRGHVHFHDDKKGLKVYVPAAVWWGAWQRLRAPVGDGVMGESFKHKDVDNNSQLIVISELRVTAVHIAMGIEAFVPPETYDRAWHALENFTNQANPGK